MATLLFYLIIYAHLFSSDINYEELLTFGEIRKRSLIIWQKYSG
jgi:hypothetical protein